MLSTLFIRHVADLGHELVIISTDAQQRVPGMRRNACVLLSSPTLLLQVRRCFKNGRMVAAMIDRGDPERRNSVYDTPAGPVRLSDALLSLALRHNARVLFLGTSMDAASQVVMRVSVPSPESRTVADILADFARFIPNVHTTRESPHADMRTISRGAEG